VTGTYLRSAPRFFVSDDLNEKNVDGYSTNRRKRHGILLLEGANYETLSVNCRIDGNGLFAGFSERKCVEGLKSQSFQG
jgi:hypothetical protein